MGTNVVKVDDSVEFDEMGRPIRTIVEAHYMKNCVNVFEKTIDVETDHILMLSEHYENRNLEKYIYFMNSAVFNPVVRTTDFIEKEEMEL